MFRPEFLNRVDETIVFHKLGREDIEKITHILISSLEKRVSAMGYSLSVTDEAISHLADAGFDEIYGARPLRRAIQSQVEDLISDEILSGKFTEGDNITIDAHDGKIILK